MLELLFAFALAQTSPTSTLTTIARGNNSKVEQFVTAVARNESEWNALWARHADSKPPQIDFSRQMAAAVFLGMRPTGGFAVEILRANDQEGQLTFEYRVATPDPELLVTQALTTPFHV